jgi:hypothetical protein
MDATVEFLGRSINMFVFLLSVLGIYQILMVLSFEPNAICLPSGEKVTDKTQSVCPINGWPSRSPVSESQMHTVVLSEPDAICLPSREKATE